jgi:hypothetical protein
MLANAYAKDTMEGEFQVKDSRLPLFVALRQTPSELASLPELIRDLLQAASCSVDESFLRQLTQGRCVVILDGLHEAGDEWRRAQVVQWLMAALAAYPTGELFNSSIRCPQVLRNGLCINSKAILRLATHPRMRTRSSKLLPTALPIFFCGRPRFLAEPPRAIRMR